MTPRAATAVMASLTLAAAAASLLLYDRLPPLLPIHWNWRGQPDGWADKSTAAFLLPGFALVLLGLMHLLPRLSPGRLSVAPFLKTFCYVFVVLATLMTHLHAIMLLTGLHPERDYSLPFLSGMFVFFALLGNVLGKVQRNAWMGIRTPWTLASDAVWIRTHRLAGRLLVAAGIVSAVAIWLGMSPAVCLYLLGAALLLPVIESYRLYRQLEG
jgi:uncharacterized membrane protein